MTTLAEDLRMVEGDIRRLTAELAAERANKETLRVDKEVLRADKEALSALVETLREELRVSHADLKTNREINKGALEVALKVTDSLRTDLEVASHNFIAANRKWQEYERDHILPCFRWATTLGIDLPRLVSENPGKNSTELFVQVLCDRASTALDRASTALAALDRAQATSNVQGSLEDLIDLLERNFGYGRATRENEVKRLIDRIRELEQLSPTSKSSTTYQAEKTK